MAHALIARCVRGLEWILADEIAGGSGPAGLRLAQRQVSFTVPRLSRRLLALRTADDLFLEVGTATGVGHTRAALPVLAARLGQLDLAGSLAALPDIRELPDKLTFDVVASLAGQRNYNRFAVEDTAGAALAPALGGRYVSRAAGPVTGLRTAPTSPSGCSCTALRCRWRCGPARGRCTAAAGRCAPGRAACTRRWRPRWPGSPGIRAAA